FCLAGLAGTASAAIPASEREALIAIYNATGGPNWTNKTGWLGAPGTECNWYGVSCGFDTVVTLFLDNNNLVCPLPPINALRNLFFLNLPGNQLSGPIPSFDGITKLTHIWLNDNRLIGCEVRCRRLPECRTCAG
ncbi:MAG TPA: hypothetical protein VM555_01620, partial [Tahibacter sp.]|nr:hypothetical protein [Tahibacter sp.]